MGLQTGQTHRERWLINVYHQNQVTFIRVIAMLESYFWLMMDGRGI